MNKQCACGEPQNESVIHRVNSPCYLKNTKPYLCSKCSYPINDNATGRKINCNCPLVFTQQEMSITDDDIRKAIDVLKTAKVNWNDVKFF